MPVISLVWVTASLALPCHSYHALWFHLGKWAVSNRPGWNSSSFSVSDFIMLVCAWARDYKCITLTPIIFERCNYMSSMFNYFISSQFVEYAIFYFSCPFYVMEWCALRRECNICSPLCSTTNSAFALQNGSGTFSENHSGSMSRTVLHPVYTVYGELVQTGPNHSIV